MAAIPGTAEPWHSADNSGTLLEEADVYKGTSNVEYVILRRTQLYADRFITYHNVEKDREDKKYWLIDPRCELSPRAVGDIKEPVTKLVRPTHMWAITTYVRTKGKPVSLVRPCPGSTRGGRNSDRSRAWRACVSSCCGGGVQDRMFCPGARCGRWDRMHRTMQIVRMG